MKVCLNNRCSSKYLEKADEIKFKYKDRNTIIDYIDKYDATILLDMRAAPEDIDWDEISRLKMICQNKFIVGAVNAEQIRSCKELEIKFYFDRPVSRYEDIKDLKRLGSQYVLIEAPLFFELGKVKEFGVPVRLAPNVAYYNNWIPKENGLYGSWIRPEDIDLYEGLIDTIEFAANSAVSEEAYYRVYCEDKSWDVSLDSLIINYGRLFGENPYIPRSFTKARLTCGQKCQSGGSCHICYKAIQLSANKGLQESLKNIIQDPDTRPKDKEYFTKRYEERATKIEELENEL